MDSRLFSRIVKELLTRDEQVILDGFGIFYVEQVPAYFSDKGYTLNPPYRKVCFKAGDYRDDVLARFYAESNSIELPRAKRLVGEYVDTLKEEVFAQKTVALPDFGRLKVISKDRVFFIQDPDLAIFPEYDLLEAVSLKSLGNFSQASQVPPSDEPAPEEPLSDEPLIDAPAPDEPLSEEPLIDAPAPEEPLSEEPRYEEPYGDEYPDEHRRRKKTSLWVVFFIVIVVLAVLFFGALAVLGRFYPDLIDPYLYNSEELELLRKL